MSAKLDAVRAAAGDSYLDLKELVDGTIVGLGRLLYTTAIYVNMDPIGWARRYCFDDAQLARIEYDKLKSGGDVPQGWIATRP